MSKRKKAKNEKDKVVTMTLVIPARLDKKMGLGLVHSKRLKEVYVRTVAPGSLAAEYFKVKDRIVSIMGEKVTDKLICRDLILMACDTESAFEVVIERHSDAFTIPEVKQEEAAWELPDLQFHPIVEQKPPGKTSYKESDKSESDKDSDKSKGKKKNKPKKKKDKRPPIAYQNYLGDDEFAIGDPLDGLTFPMPSDVRRILQLRTPQILADFLGTPTTKPTELKLSAETHTTTIREGAQEQKIGTDVTQEKSLKKPKKH